MLDAIRSRYAAICALPSRQQLLYLVALCVRANRADPTQLLLLIHAGVASWLRRGRPNNLLGKILAHFYLHAFPYFNDWAMRFFAGPRAFSDPT